MKPEDERVEGKHWLFRFPIVMMWLREFAMAAAIVTMILLWSLARRLCVY